jgi:Sulfotransferase family
MSRAVAWPRLRDAAARLSPNRRRWERFLRDLPLDPDELDSPLDPPGPDDFIICGCPRTGTTLLTAVLFQPPRIVTSMEPWDGMRLLPAQLFASLRNEVDTAGRLSRGRLDLHELRRSGRVRWCPEGEVETEVSVETPWLLGVKWPGYWRYLGCLPATRFIVCLRDPYETIASFKAAGGRVSQGLQYDTRFNRELNRELLEMTRDPALRRVLLFDYVHQRIIPHLVRREVLVVRYERWFTDHDALLRDISRFLGRQITSQHVEIRRPETADTLSGRDRGLIASSCTTAAALGYEVS